MKIGHLFLSIFEIKKKVLKTLKLSIFSISLKYSAKWGVNMRAFFDNKNIYQKILEKCEMSFCSSENKNWTFRGSFGNFLNFFRHFFHFIFAHFLKKTSNFAAFIVRRFKKNEWCEHKRATQKKRVFCDASR
jgi:hypothetical protein